MIAIAMLVVAGAGVWSRAKAQTVQPDCPTSITYGGLQGSLVYTSVDEAGRIIGTYVTFIEYEIFTIVCSG